MTRTSGVGYDGLSSKSISRAELWAFLLACFEVDEPELFVSHDDQVLDALRDVPQDVVFAVYCTYREVAGHFTMGFDVSIAGRLAAKVGRRDFAERFAANFDAYVLYGDTEPPGIWTVILPDRTRLWATLDEDDDRFTLCAATDPIPGLPDLPVRPELWQSR